MVRLEGIGCPGCHGPVPVNTSECRYCGRRLSRTWGSDVARLGRVQIPFRIVMAAVAAFAFVLFLLETHF